jgi:putative GTP pyrophosphokinase
MKNQQIRRRRQQLADFIDTADYHHAVEVVRDILRQHLLAALGGDWERMHYEYGLYSIICRVKSSKRILDKFDRLTVQGVDISVQNFYKLMPDLVGGRLVVVDPGDLFKLASLVKGGFVAPKLLEPDGGFRKLRVRHGKFSMYDPEPFRSDGYTIEIEDTGYCSVHFVYKVGNDYFQRFCDLDKIVPVTRLNECGRIPMSEWHVEVQVRTIMDEAWGEVDHFVRYEDPKLRDDLNMKTHFAALAGFLQAANHHVYLIREAARRKSKDV